MAADNRRAAARHSATTGWDPLAKWYDGWVGAGGSIYHRQLAIPAMLELLELTRQERVLDIGCGQGVLAPHVAAAGAHYTGVDASAQMIRLARRRHKSDGRFLSGDARYLSRMPELQSASFDAVAFMLSIQDMDPLYAVVDSAAWALTAGGRLAMLTTHPCFRVPRQSGWGYDPDRRLCYRRVDSYLSGLAVPMKAYRDVDGAPCQTRTFHRPLQEYVQALTVQGLVIDRLIEIPATRAESARDEQTGNTPSRAERRARREFPLLLGLRAVRLCR
ncbi:MAG TPA: class I SAM-dependent methyltransferase [Candidatus Binatia bacterium]|jgi:SAM-dependent methyltransferase|nr:class I SAM-dependent methyltransferase [Candidatus Binatia bacterium]